MLSKLEGKSFEDSVLSILNHSERRNILKLIAAAPEGVKYSTILSEANLTSGKLNYQLKEMDGFFKKNDEGEYLLSELGNKALTILYHLKMENDESETIPTSFLTNNKTSLTGRRTLAIVIAACLLLGAVSGYNLKPTDIFEERILELTQIVDDKEKTIFELDQTVLDGERKIIDLNGNISRKNELILEQNDVIKQLKTDIQNYIIQIESLLKQINELLSSDSSKPKYGTNYLSTHWHYDPYYLSDIEIRRDFKLFKEQGLTNISIVAMWNQIENIQGEYNDDALEDIIQVCEIAESYGLGVIIDFHTMMPQDSFTMPEWMNPRKFEQVFLDEPTRQSWLNYLQHCVTYLSEVENIQSWHMMNEPARSLYPETDNWACNATVDEFIQLWTEMKTIFKTHSDKPVSIRFGGDTFSTHFNRDPRIYEICDYISFNVYHSTNKDLLNDSVAQVHENGLLAMISEYGHYSNDELSQAEAFASDLSYFEEIGVDYVIAWYWRADYDEGPPGAPGTGYNIAENDEGDPRLAFRLLK